MGSGESNKRMEIVGCIMTYTVVDILTPPGQSRGYNMLDSFGWGMTPVQFMMTLLRPFKGSILQNLTTNKKITHFVSKQQSKNFSESNRELQVTLSILSQRGQRFTISRPQWFRNRNDR